MFGLFRSKEERAMRRELRELDREYQGQCHYDPDPEDGYDWGRHRAGEYDARRREIIRKYQGEPEHTRDGFDWDYDP